MKTAVLSGLALLVAAEAQAQTYSTQDLNDRMVHWR